jgi:hypothetical protein
MTETKIAKPKKLTLSIDPGLNQRLDFQVAKDGKGSDRSSLLDGLVKAHIQRPDDVSALMVDAPKSQPTDAKTSRRQPPATADKSKTTYYLSVEADRLLRLRSLMTGDDLSTIVSGLIADHVAPWDIYDRRTHHTSANPVSGKGRQSGVPRVSSPLADAA